ncbi:MAG: hypothetical protein WCF90_09945 [Methanomicrobiales archaeon]
MRSLQRGSRSNVILTILTIEMCFPNTIFHLCLFNGIGQSSTTQVVDYEIDYVLVSLKT